MRPNHRHVTVTTTATTTTTTQPNWTDPVVYSNFWAFTTNTTRYIDIKGNNNMRPYLNFSKIPQVEAWTNNDSTIAYGGAFYGVDGCLYNQDHTFAMTNPLTIAFWYKSDYLGGAGLRYFMDWLSGRMIVIQNDGLNNMAFYDGVTGGGDFIKVCTVAEVATNWHYLAWVFQTTNMLFYIDGNQRTNQPYAGTDFGGEFAIGSGNTLGAAFTTGILARIKIYPGALSASQIQTNYNNKLTETW